MVSIKTLILVGTTFFLSSCEVLFNTPENTLVCESNCYPLNLQGTVIDKTTNKGIKDIEIGMKWIEPGCLRCLPEKIIYMGTTNKSGNFTITNSIDTSYFQTGSYLTFYIPRRDQYFVFPYEDNFRISSLRDSSLKKVTFDFYPKVALKIKTERLQIDDMTSFRVEFYFSPNFHFAYENSKDNTGFRYPLNDIIAVETSADIKTYIKWTKSIGNQKIERLDSIICQKGTENIYTIRY